VSAGYHPPLDELQVSAWFNAPAPLTLEGLRGQVVVIHAFQMLCPGCVSQGLPQAQRLHQQLGNRVKVLGLHTVFEHHEVMTPLALQAFLAEYRITFPVAVDRPDPQRHLPRSMQAYQLQGTPSLIMLDRQGRVRLHEFGHVDDLQLGLVLGMLLAEPGPPTERVAGAEDMASVAVTTPAAPACVGEACRVDGRVPSGCTATVA
jgi:hypothetical protein